MQRVMPPPRDTMPASQRAVHDEIVAHLGGLSGPSGVWLHVPEMARRIAPVGVWLRKQGALPDRTREIAILVTAQFWKSEYEWYSHAKIATEVGVPAAVIDALHQGTRPPLQGPELVAWEVARALHDHHAIPDALYERALAALGQPQLIELVALCGYYTLVSMGLNAFRVALPPGVPPQFD
jgi:4-carboxymuconolactone decarboxylase